MTTDEYVAIARRLGVPAADIEKRRYSDRLIADLDYAFPDRDPGLRPTGGMLIVQERRAPKMMGSLIVADETKDFEQSRTPIGRVVALGPGAFREWKDGKSWHEGPWADVGDYIVMPRISDMKWARGPAGDEVLFRMVLDKFAYSVVTDFDLVLNFKPVAA